MTWAYRYTDAAGRPLQACPECGHDLTAAGPPGVVIHCATNSGTEFNEPSHLDDGGNLLDDGGVVAAGQHSGTACGGCGEYLINMVGVQEEEQTDDETTA